MFRPVLVNTLLRPHGPTNSIIPRSITLEITCPNRRLPLMINHYIHYQ
jgi:hypothetical protein